MGYGWPHKASLGMTVLPGGRGGEGDAGFTPLTGFKETVGCTALVLKARPGTLP